MRIGNLPTHRLCLRIHLITCTILLLVKLTGCEQRPKCSLDSLDIIPRAEWGAIEPNLDTVEGEYDTITNPGGWMVYEEPLEKVLTTIIVHHSALLPSDGPREIQQMHLQFKGYADIAYHFLIDETGRSMKDAV